MITVDFNPIFLKIGPLALRYYGLVYAFAFLAVYFLLNHLRKKEHLKLSKEQIESLLLYLILGVVIGGRLGFFIFYYPQGLLNPLLILSVWTGGMSFHGALLGVVTAIFLFAKKNKIRFIDISDNIVLPTSLALVFGRLANFINMELWGTQTDVPWCVVFSNDPLGLCRHPSQLYEAIYSLALFFIILYIIKAIKNQPEKKGLPTIVFVGLYGFFRLITNFFRDDTDSHLYVLGLSMGQILSIGMIIVSLFFAYKYYSQNYKQQNSTNHKKYKQKNKNVKIKK